MNFYDELSPLYHLIYPNWAQSVQSQATQLDSTSSRKIGPEKYDRQMCPAALAHKHLG